VHPYDYGFGDVAAEWFKDIPKNTGDLSAFAKLDPVERVLAEMQPEGDAAQVPEINEEYLRLLYAAYRFWDAGRITHDVEGENQELPSQALDEQAVAEFVAGVPAAAYFRLPEHRFWAQVQADAPHEPLDGFFLVT